LGARTFTGEFAFFHLDFWSWYWDIRQKLLRGVRLSPEEMAALLMWGRGGGKSSVVEWCCVAEGALDGAGFVMYVSATEKQAKEHVAAIKGRLESSLVAGYYPSLSRPEIGAHGNQRGWRQDYLATASGWGILPVGLDQGIRGGRKDDDRFSLIVLDDIDDHNDSPAAVEKKLETLARTILPAGAAETVVLFAQNLIHEDSVLNQIYTRRSDVLSDRREFGPYKSFDDVELEPHPVHPGKFVIKSATPTWPHLDVQAARLFLSRSGRKGFMAEYQHDFYSDPSEFVLKNWRDEVHVITRSEFALVFGARDIPDRWYKYGFNDWARTKSARHANVAGFLAVSSQNEPLPGFTFLFNCMSFPAATEADDVAIRMLKAISPRVMARGRSCSWDELTRASVTRASIETYAESATEMISARRDTLARVIPPLTQSVISSKHYVRFRGSHEQSNGALKVYRDVYGLPFQATNPGADGGVEMLNHLMHVDRTAPHPFKKDEAGADGLYRLGFSRFFLIVKDAHAAEPSASMPESLHDSDLARYQLRRWRNVPVKLNESGVVERGPQKMNDDFGNGLMMCVHDGMLQAAPLTEAEEIDMARPVGIRNADLARAAGNAEASRLVMSQMFFDAERRSDDKDDQPFYLDDNFFG
jgi:hypothetical protein